MVPGVLKAFPIRCHRLRSAVRAARVRAASPRVASACSCPVRALHRCALQLHGDRFGTRCGLQVGDLARSAGPRLVRDPSWFPSLRSVHPSLRPLRGQMAWPHPGQDGSGWFLDGKAKGAAPRLRGSGRMLSAERFGGRCAGRYVGCSLILLAADGWVVVGASPRLAMGSVVLDGGRRVVLMVAVTVPGVTFGFMVGGMLFELFA